MAIKGLLFDFNGTLFFDSPLHVEAFKRTFRSRGLAVPTSDFIAREIFGMQNEHIYKKFYNPNADAEEIKAFIAEKEGLYLSFVAEKDYDRLCDGAEELLDYLKENGIPYGIATGAEYETVLFYMKHLRLDRWFTLDNIVYTDGTFRGKPAPDIYRIAAGRLGLSPSECAVFEDGYPGLTAAAAAGIGKKFALYEEGMSDPVINGMTVDGVYHSLEGWREMLEELGMRNAELGMRN